MNKKFQTVPAIGTLITLDSPEVIEIISQCGFDWLFLDMEHGALSTIAIQRLLQAKEKSCPAFVRIPDNSPTWIKKALDTGCDGIIIPQVKNAEEVRAAVRAAKYPPVGERSVGIARAQGYGMSFKEYIASANSRVALILQIEHIDAVDNLDEILKEPGFDGIFIGPYDLSGSLSLLGEVSNKKVQDAIDEVKTKCKTKEIPFGIFVSSSEMVKKEIKDGCSFVAVGMDTMFLWNAAKDVVKKIKE
jgi:2-keto-3-deoxy-L-rhamnonate aldolase RhmA